MSNGLQSCPRTKDKSRQAESPSHALKGRSVAASSSGLTSKWFRNILSLS